MAARSSYAHLTIATVSIVCSMRYDLCYCVVTELVRGVDSELSSSTCKKPPSFLWRAWGIDHCIAGVACMVYAIIPSAVFTFPDAA